MTPYPIDDTHRPDLESWVESAADPGTDFPLQNLPLGVFRRRGSDEAPRPGVAIGDQVLDLAAAAAAGLLAAAPAAAARCEDTTLNGLATLPVAERRRFRHAVHALLRTDTSEGLAARARAELVPQAEAELLLPLHIGDYTDFYASVYHATNVGSMFRPDNPLLPNYKWVPIGYHGRASSIVPSGTPVRRPVGQTRDDGAAAARGRAHAAARLRARGGLRDRRGQSARHGDPAGGRGGPSLRALPAQRLVRARRADVGIPAARAVPGQELREHHLAVDRDGRGAGAVPHGGLRPPGG